MIIFHGKETIGVDTFFLFLSFFLNCFLCFFTLVIRIDAVVYFVTLLQDLLMKELIKKQNKQTNTKRKIAHYYLPNDLMQWLHNHKDINVIQLQ